MGTGITRAKKNLGFMIKTIVLPQSPKGVPMCNSSHPGLLVNKNKKRGLTFKLT